MIQFHIVFINFTNQVLLVDKFFSNAILSWRGPFFDAVNFIVTYLGHWFVLLIIVIFFAVYSAKRGYFYQARFLFSAYILSSALSLILKVIFGRERPSLDLALYVEHLPSFPSAHAALAFAIWGAFIFFVTKGQLTKYKKIVLVTILVLIIFLVGLSRVYLGVHFLTDVLAGYLIGILVVWRLMRRYRKYFNQKTENTVSS